VNKNKEQDEGCQLLVIQESLCIQARHCEAPRNQKRSAPWRYQGCCFERDSPPPEVARWMH